MPWMRSAAITLLATLAALAAEGDLERENERLRDQIAALKAGDPDAALRKAVENYLAGPQPWDMPRKEATAEHQGGFVLRSTDGLHALRINVLGQFGWRWYRDIRENGLTQSNFRWKHLRLRLSGHAFTERLTYFVDMELGPQAGRFTSTPDRVSEAYLVYRRIPWQYLRFKMGRMRPHFTAAEAAEDGSLAFVDRGLVNEYFTVGRTDGMAVLLENLRGGRSSFEFAITNGSERFDPDQPILIDDKRVAFTLSWARTLIGEGNPWHHLTYEGDPYDNPDKALVLAVGFHNEANDIPGTVRQKLLQFAVDLVWRHRGVYRALNVFYRHSRRDSGLAQDSDDEFGFQVTVARFLIPRRLEVAARAGWTGYASHTDPGGDLLEVTLAFSYYWKDESNRFQGHRLRVVCDVGWAEYVVTGSGTTGWPAGHVRGFQFRSLFTFFF